MQKQLVSMAFCPCQSCFSNLLGLEETVIWLMDIGNTTGVGYFDSVQSFFSVNHKLSVLQQESFSLCGRQAGVTTLSKWPFAEFLQECLEVVGNFGPPDQSYQMKL